MLCPLRLDIDPLETSPLPISLTLLKDHLAIDYTDLDDLIALNLSAAIVAFESQTHRTVLRRTHRWVLSEFPRTPFQQIRLPRGKTRVVNSVEYIAGGAAQTLIGPTSSSPAGDDFQEDLRGEGGGVIMPPRGRSWPSPDRDCPAPVTITFDAGWDAAEIPADITRALLFWLRTGIDDDRGSVDPRALEANRATFEALVSPYRLVRFY
jgi:uncharacterized phiE125 gp8 family phage protein